MHQTLSDRVLFVDDDEAVRSTFERTMKKAGIPCDIACDAAHALDLAREQSYCVVATDYAMPGKNGLELRDALRELQPDATFVLITAQCTLELAMQATNEHSFTYVLTKPWRSAELHSLMNRAAEEAWERTSARTLAKRQRERPRATVQDDNALFATVTSIVSQLCGSAAPELQRETERFRALAGLLCDAMFVASELRRDVEMASVVLAASEAGPSENDPATWLPPVGPFGGAQHALALVNERWDGRGEPDGLRGDDIDVRARILAVVRAFNHAMRACESLGSLVTELAAAKEVVISRAGAELAPPVVRALLGIEEADLKRIYQAPPHLELVV